MGKLLWVNLLVFGLAPMTGAGAASLGELPDPTRPLTGKYRTGASPGSGLQATFVAGGARLAVIGGRMYRVGDRYGENIIAEIRDYEVVMHRAGQEVRLRLVPKLPKTPVTKPTGKSTDGDMYP
jgi:hypothetical protein